jgi:hypothetical protein
MTFAPLDPLPIMPTSFHDALSQIRQLRQARSERATFVQIGANDGITNDPLYEALVVPNGTNATTDWRPYWMGLQVEPQPILFASLQYDIGSPDDWYYYNGAVVAPPLPSNNSNDSSSLQCRNDTIRFCETQTPGRGNWLSQGQVNTIHDELDRCGRSFETHMHWVQRSCVSSWTDLIHQASRKPRVRPGETFTNVPPPMQLFRGALDLLQIDAEGHDYALLAWILETERVRPLCVHYEHWGGGAAAVTLLRRNGYTVNDDANLHSNDRLACRTI